MKHFDGHNHGLKPSVSEDSGEQICSVCEVELSGEAYTCTKHDCDFILHKSCFELPKKLKHKSDPQHSFSLISEPPQYSLYYNCDACSDLIQAFGFQCDHRMHVKCALLPETVECKAHEHSLHLYYTATKSNIDGYTFFRCDVCDDAVTEGYWTYYCKHCDFVTDLNCASSAEAVPVKDQEQQEENGDKAEEQNGGEEEEEMPIELQLEKARISMENQRAILEFQMQMSRQNAAFMNGLANSWSKF